MKTERYITDDGDFYCFGILNTFIGKKGALQAVKELPDCTITYSSRSIFVEHFCSFSYKNKVFEISEPYGDNSYYDVCCTEPNTPELEEVHERFAQLQVPSRSTRWLLIIAVLCIGLLFLAAA